MHDNDAIFSKDGVYRYALSRRIEDPFDATPTERRLLAVMLNPSKAGAVILGKPINDLTITKCMGFARKWGFGHLRVVNFYALVSTNPKGLLAHSDPIGPENDYYLDMMARWADDIWLAWGDNSIFRTEHGRERLLRGKRIVEEAAAVRHVKRFHLGLTKSGQPKHPSRISYDTKRVEVFE